MTTSKIERCFSGKLFIGGRGDSAWICRNKKGNIQKGKSDKSIKQSCRDCKQFKEPKPLKNKKQKVKSKPKTTDGSLINSRSDGMRALERSLGIPCPFCAQTIPPGEKPIPSLSRNFLNRQLECEICAFYLTAAELQNSVSANAFSEIVDKRIVEMNRGADVERTAIERIKEISESSVVITTKRKKRRVDF